MSLYHPLQNNEYLHLDSLLQMTEGQLDIFIKFQPYMISIIASSQTNPTKD